MNETEIALEESLKLQSHYANLLNQYDGGERIVFRSSKEWIERLKKVGAIPSNKSVEPTLLCHKCKFPLLENGVCCRCGAAEEPQTIGRISP